jgi:arginyl-tRNA synthetase
LLRREIVARIEAALTAAARSAPFAPVVLTSPTSHDAGDYTCATAVHYGRTLHDPAAGLALAEAIARTLRAEPDSPIAAVTVSGPGYLTIHIAPDALVRAIAAALAAGESFGQVPVSEGAPRCLIEYVSADPTSPITAGHARGAVLGDTLARLLRARGIEASREFYVNDAPSATLTAFFRAVRQLPTDGAGFSPSYVARVAGERTGNDDDALLAAVRAVQTRALTPLGVGFDRYVSENALLGNGSVTRILTQLEADSAAETRGEALWLRSTAFGDAQDRVLRRPGGRPTYLAADLAYHADKFARGYESLLNLWDIDHAPYVPRTQAGLEALGLDSARLSVLVYQSVRVLKDGVERNVGRFGPFVTLEELLDDVPAAALRLALAQVPPDQPVDLDLDRLAESRDVAVLRRAAASVDPGDPADVPAHPDAAALARLALEWPSELEEAVRRRAVHGITRYALALAERIATFPDGAPRAAVALARRVANQCAEILGMENSQ